MSIIEVNNIVKSFRGKWGRKQVALDGLTFRVENGVHALLGPNGAGKTTALRCILRLTRPNSGSCSVLGVDSTENLDSVIDRVGSVLDTVSFDPALSGRRTLTILATIAGIGRRKIDEVLERVNLLDRADDRIKTYSYGMRRRLELAAALLKDPDLLLLDEPTNGLDPAGIKDFRSLIRSLASEGRTILTSTHLLSEAEAVCDAVTIIQLGKSVRSGPTSEILSGFVEERIRIQVDDPVKAKAVLVAGGFEIVEESGRQLWVRSPGGPSPIVEVLGKSRIFPTEVLEERPTLETAFLKLTEGEEP